MDEQLLIRFLTHTCTPEDIRLVDQWIASAKSNADWLFEMERIWSLKDELRFSDKREIGEAYTQFILLAGKKNKNGDRHLYIYPILKYAAAVLIRKRGEKFPGMWMNSLPPLRRSMPIPPCMLPR